MIESLGALPWMTRPQTRAVIEALGEHQDANDVVLAFSDLRRAYETDVAPILAMARYEAGGAIDPIDVYRTSEWRPRKAQERGRASTSAGIV